MNQPIDVVGAIIVRGGKVLAAQRGPGMALEGMWEFPGGKIEQGEHPEAALVREIREELGCAIEVGAHVGTTLHKYDFATIRLSTYYATMTAGEPAAREHAALRWVPLAELSSLTWAPADIPAVERVMRWLSGHPEESA